MLLGTASAFAQTRVQQIALDANDGNRITGFIYQNRQTEKNAPLAKTSPKVALSFVSHIRLEPVIPCIKMAKGAFFSV